MGRYFLLGFFLSFLLLGSWDESLLLELWRAVRPIFAGTIVAAFLWPICCFLEEKLPLKRESFRRGAALLTLATGILLVVALSLWLLLPALKNSIFSVWELLSGSFSEVADRYPKLRETAETGWSLLKQGDFTDKLQKTAGSVFDVLTGVAVAFLLLYKRREIAAAGKLLLIRLCGKKAAIAVIGVGKTAVRVFGSFFLGQLTEALVIGSGCLLFLLLFSFPYWLEIALITAVTAMIPAAGAILGTAIGCAVLLSDSLQKALVFLVFMLLLQWVENLVIYPRVVGKTVGLSSLGTFTAVIVGGKLFGAMGVLFFVPFLGTVKQLLPKFLSMKPEIKEPE